MVSTRRSASVVAKAGKLNKAQAVAVADGGKKSKHKHRTKKIDSDSFLKVVEDVNAEKEADEADGSSSDDEDMAKIAASIGSSFVPTPQHTCSSSLADNRFTVGPSLDTIGCRSKNTFSDKFNGVYCFAQQSAVDTKMNGLQNVDRSEAAPKHLTADEKKRRRAKEKETAGKAWFGMGAPELTTELKNDLRVIRNRGYIDPKRHYKKENLKWPKFFAVGTVIEGKHEFFSSRVSRRDRKQTLADEIIADTGMTSYMKRKSAEIQASKPNKKKLKWSKQQRGSRR